MLVCFQNLEKSELKIVKLILFRSQMCHIIQTHENVSIILSHLLMFLEQLQQILAINFSLKGEQLFHSLQSRVSKEVENVRKVLWIEIKVEGKKIYLDYNLDKLGLIMVQFRRQCQFKTMANSRCNRLANGQNNYCWQHIGLVVNPPSVGSRKNGGVVSRVIAFDFDCTILATHSIMNDWTPELVEHMSIQQVIRASSPLFNNAKFIQMLKMNHQNGNARYIVTSYGNQDVIRSFLQRLRIMYLFDQILTPCSFGLMDGYDVFIELDGKNRMLERIETSYHLTRNRILLIDDSYQNIKAARSQNYLVIQVDRNTGLTDQEGILIAKFLNYQYRF